MDDAVMNGIKKLTCAMLLLLPPAAWAVSDANLPDPTRPAIVEKSVVPGDGQATAVLQSVFLRKGGKSGAVINGQTVEVGGEIMGARLIRVTETEVTLLSDAGKEILKLNPAVEKKPVIEKTQAKPMVSNRKKTAGKAAP